MRRVSSAGDSVCSEGRSFGPAEYIVRGARRRKAGPGFYRYFGNRVETWSCEARGLDEGINFFNGLLFLSQNTAVPAAERDTSSTAC
jgi:hypothetical protein